MRYLEIFSRFTERYFVDGKQSEKIKYYFAMLKSYIFVPVLKKYQATKYFSQTYL